MTLPLQFTLQARDNRNPERMTQATATVTVNRNEYLAEFQGKPYSTDLSENKNVGSNVITVVARDLDLQVIKGYCKSCTSQGFDFRKIWE